MEYVKKVLMWTLFATVSLTVCSGKNTVSVNDSKTLVMFWNVENFFDWTDQ